MPIFLFTVRTNNRMMAGMGGRGMNPGTMGSSLMSFDKQTGKKLYPKEPYAREFNSNEGLFTGVDVNPRSGSVELIRPNFKIVHSVDTDDRSARADGPGEVQGGASVGAESEKILHGGAIIEKK